MKQGGIKVENKCQGGNMITALFYVATQGLSTEKCNPQGHQNGKNTLNYDTNLFESQCKGTGDVNNRIITTDYEKCTDSNNGALNKVNMDCSF